MAKTMRLGPELHGALDIVMRVRGFNDSSLGKTLGVDRNSIRKRRIGETPLRAGDLEAFAQVMHVPVDLFHRTAAEIYNWFAAEADPDLQSPQSAWLTADDSGELHELAEVA